MIDHTTKDAKHFSENQFSYNDMYIYRLYFYSLQSFLKFVRRVARPKCSVLFFNQWLNFQEQILKLVSSGNMHIQ